MVLARLGMTSQFLCLMFAAQVVHASPTAPARHHDLQNTHWQFLMGESLVAGGSFASAWLFTGGTSQSCRWCGVNSFDDSIRNALRANNPRPPALLSHVLSVGSIPVLGLTGLIAPAGFDRQWQRGLQDTIIVTNTFLVTGAVGEAVKHIVARQRPAFHYGVESSTEFSSRPAEQNKSFFSLDTAWAFSLASSSATLAFMRGYSTAPYIAIGGGLMAVGAGTLRIVSDVHWATDVLTGAFIGTGIGVAVPLLLHGRRKAETSETPMSISVVPLARGYGVSVAFVF